MSDASSASLFGQYSFQFLTATRRNRAQQVAITQAQEQEKASNEQVMTDVEDAYEERPTAD